MKNSDEYQRGYRAAQEAIAKDKDIRELFLQPEGSPDYNDFDRGWQQCCRDNGATDNY